jgi:hypothetical protein
VGDRFSYINAVNFSHDGAYVVSAYAESIVRVWSVATGVQVARFRHTVELLRTVQFSDDQRAVLAQSIYTHTEPQWFDLQQDLWPPENKIDGTALLRFETYMISDSGWLYYSGTPNRRACWIPARLRSNHGIWNQNGCLLSMSRSRDLLCVTIT